MPPLNKAAFYPSDRSPALTISPSPYPTLNAGEVLIKVSAAGINPIDWKIQEAGTSIFPFLTYPLAGGIDISGTVIQANPNDKFRPGDRVLSFPSDFTSRSGGFQTYAVAPASLTSRIPDSIPFTSAAVLPSGVATAAVGLFHPKGLGLASLPAIPPRARNGETVFIPGGATCVGSNAIQLAVAAGYEVITTSSPVNFTHCMALGASLVFDYRSPDLLRDLTDAFRGRRCAGGFSTVEGSNEPAFAVVSASKRDDEDEDVKHVACTILFKMQGIPRNIRAEMIHGYWIKDTPLAQVIFDNFLPEALASGQYKCVPEPLVVGQGLKFVQVALDKGKTNSVSCQKLVVSLEEET